MLKAYKSLSFSYLSVTLLSLLLFHLIANCHKRIAGYPGKQAAGRPSFLPFCLAASIVKKGTTGCAGGKKEFHLWMEK